MHFRSAGSEIRHDAHGRTLLWGLYSWGGCHFDKNVFSLFHSLSRTVLMLWWKSHPRVGLILMGNYSNLSDPSLRAGLLRGLMSWYRWGARGWGPDVKWKVFLLQGLVWAWLSLGNAIKRSFLQSKHIVYIWPKYGMKERCFEQKAALITDGEKKSLKLNFQGLFWAFLKSRIGKYFVCLWI